MKNNNEGKVAIPLIFLYTILNGKEEAYIRGIE